MEPLWKIQLLGQLCARSGAEEVTRFRTRKTAELLAYLAYHRHRSHVRETLLDLLWPGEDIGAARNSFSVALNSLRKQFEPPGVPRGAFLFADRTHVRILPEACITDAETFAATLEAMTHQEDGAALITPLTQAISLYQGDLLPGYYTDWILAEQERLRELYIGGLRRLVKCLAQGKDYSRALSYAQRAIQADPLREASYRDVMRLYAAVGQPAAGLEKFQELTRTLQESLGISPSPATRELAQQLKEAIGQGGAVVRMPARPAAAAAPVAPAASEPAPAADSSPAPVPMPFTRFFGREAEKETLVERLSPASPVRLITLTGLGGSGKTRLSIEVAHALQAAYSGAIYFVGLAAVTEAALLPETLREALRLPSDPEADPLEAVIHALSERPALLVLDNFEQLLPQDEDGILDSTGPQVVQMLLERAPELRCLVTSRHILDLSGEQEFGVAPLPVPSCSASPEELITYPGVQLFVNRAQARRVDFQVTLGNAEAIATICAQLEGIPLALELAAGWAKMLTPTQMVQRLENRLAFLVSRHGDLPERHRALRATIEASYLLLPPAVRAFFERLAVFRNGWTLEAAEAICEEPFALERLLHLRDSSLIVAEETPDQMRYRMLETIRAYAQEKLSQSEAFAALRDRHAAYFLEWVTPISAKLRGSEDEATEAVQLLTQEGDNVRAGMDWAVQQGQDRQTVEYGLAFTRFLAKQSLYAECDTRLTQAAEAARRLGDNRSLAGLLNRHGLMAWERSDNAKARAYLSESYTLSKACDYTLVTLASLSNLGNIAWGQGDFEEARTRWEEALTLADQHQMTAQIGPLCNNLGLLAGYRGDFATAERYLQRSLRLAQEGENLENLAHSLYIHSEVLWRQGRSQEAIGQAEEAHRLFQEMGMTRSQALISAHLGRYWLDGEHFAEAEQYARESMILATEAGVRLGQMYALHVLACVYAGREELEQAQAMFQQSCQMAHRIGDRRHIADVLRSYGEALALQGQTETAYLALTVAAREYASLEMMDATPTLALQQQQRARIEPSRLQRLDSEAQALSLEGILQAMEPPQITA